MLWLLAIIGAALIVYTLVYVFSVFYFDCDLSLAYHEKFGKPIESLKGKVVFITGASSGIGEHTAYAFAKRGVKLVLAARRKIELDRVKQECLQLSNGALGAEDVLVLEMDMLKLDKHEEYFKTAVDHFGTIDVIFNNAGRSQRGIWERIAMQVDKEMFELNLFSVINLTRVALAHFTEKGKGHVVVTSSVAGVFGVPHSASYTGSKHALHVYMNALRNEKLRANIAVSVICPGTVFTNFLQHSFTEQPGVMFGIKVQPTDHRMKAERCGELCAVTIANQLNESWMALFPFLPLLYITYFPNICSALMRYLGPEGYYKLRDNRKLDF
ncbi:dehydrogenase/reductase SDR family member 7-like isoform X2 [Atheta coriaria]|uniref:dehydrogenase/reductase SDR family member 7-like isoform X2 n=1 Tax=Dalotia coriaria TaxID=877792 RepID=UPI0031F3F846